MKTCFLSLFILLSSLLFSDELSWVKEQVQAIKPPRAGMSQRAINAIESPFVFTKEKKEKKEKKSKDTKKQTIVKSRSASQVDFSSSQVEQRDKTVLSLAAIINKSAMINGKWYKIGNSLYGYKIRKISYSSVLLVKHRKRLLLSTKSRSSTIKFQK